MQLSQGGSQLLLLSAFLVTHLYVCGISQALLENESLGFGLAIALTGLTNAVYALSTGQGMGQHHGQEERGLSFSCSCTEQVRRGVVWRGGGECVGCEQESVYGQVFRVRELKSCIISLLLCCFHGIHVALCHHDARSNTRMRCLVRIPTVTSEHICASEHMCIPLGRANTSFPVL